MLGSVGAETRPQLDQIAELTAQLATTRALLDGELNRARALTRVGDAIGSGGVVEVIRATVQGAVDLTAAAFGAFYGVDGSFG
ncbi:hypothetical protein, partial [Caulobacter sp.]|uniref:hypothetical protein n=1 Tax=Caulobacter sp. TaxID=78 RepID=UPI003BAE50D8